MAKAVQVVASAACNGLVLTAAFVAAAPFVLKGVYWVLRGVFGAMNAVGG